MIIGKLNKMIDDIHNVTNELQGNILDNRLECFILDINNSEIPLGVEDLISNIYDLDIVISKKSYDILLHAVKYYDIKNTEIDIIVYIEDIDDIIKKLHSIANEFMEKIQYSDITYFIDLIDHHKICISVEFILTCIVQNDIILSQAIYDILMDVVKQCGIHEDYYQDIKHSES